MQNSIHLTTTKVPNPNAIKFCSDPVELVKGAYNFSNPEEAESSPLAKKLFQLGFVEQVFICRDFVTVSKKEKDSPEWDLLLQPLRVVIKNHIQSGEPLLGFDEDENAGFLMDGSVEAKLKEVFQKQIRPATMEDGGDMTFSSFENGIVKVNLSGACVKCPYAPRTIKAGIEKILKEKFPEVLEVTSDDVDWSNTGSEK